MKKPIFFGLALLACQVQPSYELTGKKSCEDGSFQVECLEIKDNSCEISLCYRVLEMREKVYFVDGSSFGYGRIIDRGCDGTIDLIRGMISPCPIQGVPLSSCIQSFDVRDGYLDAKYQILFDSRENEKRFERSCRLIDYE